MLTVQNLPHEIKDFILRNQLLDEIPNERGAGLRPALAESAATAGRGITDAAPVASRHEALWQAARQYAARPPQALAAPGRKPGTSADPAKLLLADHYHGTVHTIAESAAVPADTAAELLSLTAAVGLRLLGQQAAEQGWDAAALGQWLQAQRPAQAAPNVAPAGIPLGIPVLETPPAAGPKVRSNTWLWLAALVLTSGVSYFVGVETAPTKTVRVLPENALASTERFALPTVTDARLTAYDAANPITLTVDNNFHAAGGYPVVNAGNTSPGSGGGYVYGNAGVPVVLKFGDGTQQIIGANSTESRLYQFLANPRVQVDSLNPLNDWINFDRIYFESSKDELSFESKWQLSNIARILTTFPDAKVRIGGYTDSSGDPTYNLKLSRDRAEGARSTLIGLGVNPDNIVATGYGIVDNIASNATPDGRALNRRVSIRVLTK